MSHKIENKRIQVQVVNDDFTTVQVNDNNVAIIVNTNEQDWIYGEHMRIRRKRIRAVTNVSGGSPGGGSEPQLLSVLVMQGFPENIQMSFNVDVNITLTGWSVSTDSANALSISSVDLSGTSQPYFTLSREILPGENLTITYSDGDTESTVSIPLANIADLAITNNVYYWADDFEGTVADTTRFTVSNPNTGNLTISQSDAKIFTRTTDTDISSALDNNVHTNLLFSYGVFSVYINKTVGFENSTPVFRYIVDANNFISIQGSPSNVRVAIQLAGSSLEYDVTTSVSIDGVRVRFIFDSSNNITFQYWNGSAWIALPSTSQQNFNVGSSGTIQMSTNSSSLDAVNDSCVFQQLRYAASAWDTELPEDFFFNILMDDTEVLWTNQLITFDD